MKNKSILPAYIKHIRFYIIIFTAFSAVFGLFAWLEGLGFDNIVYAAILLAAGCIVAACIGYIRYKRKHEYLKQYLLSTGSNPGPLRDYRAQIDRDYAGIIASLSDALQKTVSDSNRKTSEMEDYYALWAHQIKTPIAAMRLIIQADEAKNTSELSAELFRIEQYVEMVLQYIRSESSSGDYVIEYCDLDTIVKAAVKKYAASFIRSRISLVYEPLEYKALTDSKWLGFVLEQILSNALKYTKLGSVTIKMNDSTLIISDTGIGIRPEDIPRIFENSFTGYNGRADSKSTGIGLYLTKRILDALGHKISITSVLGKGTDVYIDLGREKLGVE